MFLHSLSLVAIGEISFTGTRHANRCRDVSERHLQAISGMHVCAKFSKDGTAARKNDVLSLHVTRTLI